MELELNQSSADPNTNMKQVINHLLALKYGKFQKQLYYTVCKQSMILSFDLCCLLILTKQPLIIALYLIGYCFGSLTGMKIQKPIEQTLKIGYSIQIIIILLITMSWIQNQNEILLILISLKSLCNGYIGCILQFLKYSLLDIHFNVGYFISALLAFQFLISTYYLNFKLQGILILEELFILISCLHKIENLPPLIEQVQESEMENYVKYIENCTLNESMINYSDYKNRVDQERRSYTMQSIIQINKPNYSSFFKKIRIYQKQIYRYFLNQAILGFLFYSNLMYMKYYYLGENRITYLGILLLSISQSFSKLVNEKLVQIYPSQQVYYYTQLICIISQIVRAISFYANKDRVTFMITTLLSSIFHHSIQTEIDSDYRSFILQFGSIAKHIGGIIVAYTLEEYLEDKIYEFLFIQTTLTQIIYCYLGCQKLLSFS